MARRDDAVSRVASMLARLHGQRVAAVAFSAWAVLSQHLRFARRVLLCSGAAHRRLARGAMFRSWAVITLRSPRHAGGSGAGSGDSIDTAAEIKVTKLSATSWREWAGRECGNESYQRFDVVRGILQMVRRPFSDGRSGRSRCVFGQQGKDGRADGCWPRRHEDMKQDGSDVCDRSSFSFMGSTSIYASSDDSPSSHAKWRPSAQPWSSMAAESITTGVGSLESCDIGSLLGSATDQALLRQVSQLRTDIDRLQRVVALSAAQSSAIPQFGHECSAPVQASVCP